MKVLIVSDLHLGSPLFNKKISFLNLMQSTEYDMIVLNGDVIDIWEEKLNKIINNNIRIIETINVISKQKTVVYIEGNHDPKTEDIRKIFPNCQIIPSFQIEDLFIIHGDEFDKLVSKYSWLVKLLFIPHWIGERFGLNIKAFFRELTHSISNKRNKNYYTNLVKDINNEAISKYSCRCNFLVMGHTHSPKIIEEAGCVYINGGDLIHNYTYVEFDTITKKFELKRM